MRRRTRDSVICHTALVIICLLAILCGWAVSRAGASTTRDEPPAWTLLKEKLGKPPNKAGPAELGIAMREALQARPDLLIPLVQTCASLACKMPYKRAVMLMVVQTAVDTRPDRLVDIVDAAYAICPDGVRGVEDKLVVATPEPDDLTPKWVPPEFPPTNIWSAVTPVTNR